MIYDATGSAALHAAMATDKEQTCSLPVVGNPARPAVKPANHIIYQISYIIYHIIYHISYINIIYHISYHIPYIIYHSGH